MLSESVFHVIKQVQVLCSKSIIALEKKFETFEGYRVFVTRTQYVSISFQKPSEIHRFSKYKAPCISQAVVNFVHSYYLRSRLRIQKKNTLKVLLISLPHLESWKALYQIEAKRSYTRCHWREINCNSATSMATHTRHAYLLARNTQLHQQLLIISHLSSHENSPLNH